MQSVPLIRASNVYYVYDIILCVMKTKHKSCLVIVPHVAKFGCYVLRSAGDKFINLMIIFIKLIINLS